MIHSINRTSGLFEPDVADEINNAFSDINDKIERFERPEVYNTLELFPVQVKAKESFSIVNNSIKAGNAVYLNIQIELTEDSEANAKVDVVAIDTASDSKVYGPVCKEGSADSLMYELDGQNLSIGFRTSEKTGTILVIQDYFIVGA